MKLHGEKRARALHTGQEEQLVRRGSRQSDFSFEYRTVSSLPSQSPIAVPVS